MKEIVIRKAKIADVSNIQRLNSDLFKKEIKEYDTSLDRKWSMSKEAGEYFSDRISKKDGFVLVVEDNKKIVGYLCGGLSVRFCRIKAKHAELENMLIEKKYRGLGIGKKLGRAFLDWCDQEKVRYITVTASTKNVEAVGYYKSLGFDDYDTTLQIER